MNKRQKEIIDYYESCESDYRLLWDLDYSQAMHAGYWDENTRSLREALRRENEILAEIAAIQRGDKVLDAGCGVGGSAIYLAKALGCDVLGITLSAQQVQVATHYAHKAGVQERARFRVLDYTDTGLPDDSFDVVWGIESICHTIDKRLFIREAARLLKPNGRLIVADGFMDGPISHLRDLERMKCWLNGWGVESLDSINHFKNSLQSEGFTDIRYLNITQNVLPSSRRLFWLAWPAIPLSRLGERLKWRTQRQTANLISARYQYQTLKKGLWQYGIFCGTKH